MLSATRQFTRRTAQTIGRRNFAAGVMAPAPGAAGNGPLSFRMKSLVVGCFTAAIIYYVPQDLIFLAAAYQATSSGGQMINYKVAHPNVETAFQEWKASKNPDAVKGYDLIEKSGSTAYVLPPLKG